MVSKSIRVAELTPAEQEAAKNETVILASLKHPNIIGYYESFTAGGILYIVMDYAAGGDLAQKIKSAKEPFPEDVILDYFVQIALALYTIHSRHILHRDLKGNHILSPPYSSLYLLLSNDNTV